jgi:hypothetical protein
MARRIDPRSTPYLRALFYGIPGSTKTRTVGTACLDKRSAPVLWLDAAGNPISIREYDPGPDIIKIEELKDLNDPYVWIKAGQPKDHPFCKQFQLEPPYRTLVVDQITDVQRISYELVTNNKEGGPGDIPKPHQIQHFLGIMGQMVKFAKLYYDLPLHVIMTAQEKSEKDDITGVVRNAPLLWGQSDVEVPGYAYLVARLVHRAVVSPAIMKVVEDSAGGEAEKIASVAFFLPSGKYVAKDQYGALGPYMANPTISKMLDLIWPETKNG